MKPKYTEQQSLIPSNFDHWWQLYSKHCPRMDKKSQCKKRFESFSEPLQRVICQDTRDRLKHYDDWQETTPKGKRKFMRGPYPYLNPKMWESPVDKKPTPQCRDTTNEQIRPEQQLAGLQAQRKLFASQGLDTSVIDRQINSLNG